MRIENEAKVNRNKGLLKLISTLDEKNDTDHYNG